MARPKKLDKLGPQHRMAVSLRLAGKKNREVAEALNVSKTTVDWWFQRKLVKQEVERQAELFSQTIREKIASGVQQTLDIALARISANGVMKVEVRERDEDGEWHISTRTEAVPLDEAPISDEQRFKLIERLLELHPDTQHPSSTEIPPDQPDGAGDTTNILQIIGAMDPEQIRQLGAAAAKELVEGKAKEKKK